MTHLHLLRGRVYKAAHGTPEGGYRPPQQASDNSPSRAACASRLRPLATPKAAGPRSSSAPRPSKSAQASPLLLAPHRWGSPPTHLSDWGAYPWVGCIPPRADRSCQAPALAPQGRSSARAAPNVGLVWPRPWYLHTRSG